MNVEKMENVGWMEFRESDIWSGLEGKGEEVSFDIKEAAEFLKVSTATLQGLAKKGEVTACKIGRRWVFIREHLVEHMSNRYANARGGLRLVENNQQSQEGQCPSTKKETSGTSISSASTAKEYANLLALPTKTKRKSCTTA